MGRVNLVLRYIGTDGSCGLKHGNLYDCYIRSYCGMIGLNIMLVKPIGFKQIPYQSIAAMLKNWEEVNSETGLSANEIRRLNGLQPYKKGGD